MKECLKENKWMILSLSLVGLFTYGIRIVCATISIDTECIMIDPDQLYAGWLSIGRYILVGIKQLEGIPFNRYLANIGTYFFFFLSILVWIKQLEKLFEKRVKTANLLFGLLLLTTPILAEQFAYTLQNVEVAFAFLLFSIGMSAIQKFVYENQKRYAIISVILFCIPFGIYQGFVPLFLTLCAFIYLVRDEKSNTKEAFIHITKYIGIFVLILAIYYAGNQLVITLLDISSSSYLKEQIFWGREPIGNTIRRIATSIGAVALRIWYQIQFII